MLDCCGGVAPEPETPQAEDAARGEYAAVGEQRKPPQAPPQALQDLTGEAQWHQGSLGSFVADEAHMQPPPQLGGQPPPLSAAVPPGHSVPQWQLGYQEPPSMPGGEAPPNFWYNGKEYPSMAHVELAITHDSAMQSLDHQPPPQAPHLPHMDLMQPPVQAPLMQPPAPHLQQADLMQPPPQVTVDVAQPPPQPAGPKSVGGIIYS